MKKILLSLMTFVMVAIAADLQAQCTVSNLSVVIKNVTSGPGGCQVTVDLSFTGDFNNGNKYAFIHLWENAPVNNYPNLTYVNPPTATELANALGTLVVQDPGKTTAALYNQYPPNVAVPVIFSGVTFSKTGNVFTITNVVLTLSTCDVPVTVKGDVWASQASDGQVVHCFNQGEITILFNNPIISGVKQCIRPRLLNLYFENAHPTITESVVAEVFIDVNSNGLIDGGDVNITSSLSPAFPNPLILGPASNTGTTYFNLAYPPYSGDPAYDKPVIVRANASAPGAATVTITKNNITFLGECIILPVNFKSFTATRNRANVVLKWETMTEQNSNGFAVERNIGNTGWEQITFVPSQAPNGNSSDLLAYQYVDPNNAKGITQYRIKQVDIDNRSRFSEIRAVRGEGQLGKTIVYPNPTNDGRVTIVFEETNIIRDVTVMDMSGRIIRQMRSISNNNIQIDNLPPGMYSLRIVAAETGEQSVQKIVVNKR